MGPDHPHIEIYLESKHGNIYSAEGESWNWTSDDWRAGEDYRAPTCAVCHMSAAGDDVPATHDVSSRLAWELEPAVSRRTDNTANSLGVAISDGSTWQEKAERMQTVCLQCHSTTWVENYYVQADIAVELYNEQYLEAKAIVDALYAEGLLTSDSFDEEIEFILYEMWHHEGRRARMGAWMMGPDYTQWHGFYEMLGDRVEIEHIAEELRAAANETVPEHTHPLENHTHNWTVPDHTHEDVNGHDDDDEHEEGEFDELIGWSIPIMIIVGFLILAATMAMGGRKGPQPSMDVERPSRGAKEPPGDEEG
jgi:hypothetical protein